jgi:hypothetical protein
MAQLCGVKNYKLLYKDSTSATQNPRPFLFYSPYGRVLVFRQGKSLGTDTGADMTVPTSSIMINRDKKHCTTDSKPWRTLRAYPTHD